PHAAQTLRESVGIDRLTVDPHAFAKFVEVGLRVEAGAQAGGAKGPLDHGGSRALPIGPGNEDRWVAALGIAQRQQDLARTVKGQAAHRRVAALEVGDAIEESRGVDLLGPVSHALDGRRTMASAMRATRAMAGRS